jgi:hypothetical protein
MKLTTNLARTRCEGVGGGAQARVAARRQEGCHALRTRAGRQGRRRLRRRAGGTPAEPGACTPVGQRPAEHVQQGRQLQHVVPLLKLRARAGSVCVCVWYVCVCVCACVCVQVRVDTSQLLTGPTRWWQQTRAHSNTATGTKQASTRTHRAVQEGGPPQVVVLQHRMEAPVRGLRARVWGRHTQPLRAQCTARAGSGRRDREVCGAPNTQGGAAHAHINTHLHTCTHASGAATRPHAHLAASCGGHVCKRSARRHSDCMQLVKLVRHGKCKAKRVLISEDVLVQLRTEAGWCACACACVCVWMCVCLCVCVCGRA